MILDTKFGRFRSGLFQLRVSNTVRRDSKTYWLYKF